MEANNDSAIEFELTAERWKAEAGELSVQLAAANELATQAEAARDEAQREASKALTALAVMSTREQTARVRAAGLEAAIRRVIFSDDQPTQANAYGWWIGERKVLRLHLADHAGALAEHDEAKDAEIQALSHQLEADRTTVAEQITAAYKLIDGFYWLVEGRGSYEWNDDRYQEEFTNAAVKIREALEPLKKVAADWTGCPKTSAEVARARVNKDAEIQSLTEGRDDYKESMHEIQEHHQRYVDDVRKTRAEKDAEISRLTARVGEMEAKDKESETFCRDLVCKFAKEKTERIEYQDALYAVCLELDKGLGNSSSRGRCVLAEKIPVVNALTDLLARAKAEGAAEALELWANEVEHPTPPMRCHHGCFKCELQERAAKLREPT